MKSLLRATVLVAMLTYGSALAAQISIGIRIGSPPPPRVVRVIPPTPGPGFVWVEGYWYPVGNHYRWHNGYWTRPPYPMARWVVAHYDGEQYFAGYWEGQRGRVEHDHRWDKDKYRDYRDGRHEKGHHGKGDDRDR